MDLNTTYATIESLLELEEKSQEQSIPDHEKRRKLIDEQIRALNTSITPLLRRFHNLPSLPPEWLVDWAQAVLKFSNLAFVVLDTTGVDQDSDIIRVLAADREADSLFDYLVRPQRQQHANTAYTSIAQEELDTSPSLANMWPFLQHSLAGHYVLAYNLNFIKERLDENAEHYGLPKIVILGEDLQDKARQYWEPGRYYPLKLVDLCARIGHQLPSPPTAPDRVAGQYALLQAMSQGVVNVSQPKPEEEDEDIF